MSGAAHRRLYFEIGPLKEREYTGISQVTAALAEQALGDGGRDVRFFYGRVLVDRPVVEDLLRRRDGGLLEWHLQRARRVPVPEALDRENVAIFPNRKSCRRGFAREVQIIHDLSTLLTPHFHAAETIDYHALSMEDDILSNDLTLCVSEATRGDVLAYFPDADPARVVALPIAAGPGIAGPDRNAPAAEVEPYILVLGTIEPRKNIGQVLDHIAADPAILRRFRFVFPGRFGWGDTLDHILEEAGLRQHVADGTLLFPGFVSEEVKDALIRHARLLVYPSLFEGFGLPVLEALSVGVPCVTTRSSSLPEVGGPGAFGFDPFTAGDFDRALEEALAAVQADRAGVRARCLAWAAQFSWPRTYARLVELIEALPPAGEA